jgi:NAD(P)-dependent dehydrogenase (short-subunit alcohol dehydrogenase family)
MAQSKETTNPGRIDPRSAYLASPAASYVIGATIAVTGGDFYS